MQVISQSKLNKLVSAFIGLLSVFQLVIPHAYAQSPAIHKARLSISANPFVSLVVEKNNGSSSQKILISDYLSSTKVIVSHDSTPTNTSSYYPYGSSRTQLTTSQSTKQYTGQTKVIDDSSVYDYNARYYNPTTGLFIQPDSVKGPNRYGYVSGNPIMAHDPTGNDLCQSDPRLKYFWRAIGQCGGDQAREDFMGEEGLNSVGTLMATTEAASGIGGIATAIGDKINGNKSGSETIDSAYKSLPRNIAIGILVSGLIQADWTALNTPGKRGVIKQVGDHALVFPNVLRDIITRNNARIYTRHSVNIVNWRSGKSQTIDRIVSEIKAMHWIGREDIAEQIAILTKKNMPYRADLASLADRQRSLDDICALGGAICRHNVGLSTGIAESLGIPSREMISAPSILRREAGHANTIMDFGSPNVFRETGGDYWVLDGTEGRIFTMHEYINKRNPGKLRIYSPSTKKFIPFER